MSLRIVLKGNLRLKLKTEKKSKMAQEKSDKDDIGGLQEDPRILEIYRDI